MKKEEILQKIEPLFYEKSYKEVSLQDVANIFEIKKSSLYYYFASKEDMFFDVLEYSFNKYLNFIKDLISRWNKNNFQELLIEFINYWDNEKNVFFRINQSGYSWSDKALDLIQYKQKIIFDEIHNAFYEKAWFSKERTYLFLVLINQTFNNNWVYWKCELNNEHIPSEIEKIFFNS